MSDGSFSSEVLGTPASREEIRDIAASFGWTLHELPNSVDVFSHPKRHSPDKSFPKPDFDGHNGYPAQPITILWHNGKQYLPSPQGWSVDIISAWSAHFIFDVDLGDREIDLSVGDDGIVVFPPQSNGGCDAR